MSATKRPSAVAGLKRGLGGGQAEPPETKVASRDFEPLPRPEKPVRFTLDLDQDRHAFLKTFALECGAGTGGAAVMRALLDELRDSPTLAMKVRARLRGAGR